MQSDFIKLCNKYIQVTFSSIKDFLFTELIGSSFPYSQDKLCFVLHLTRASQKNQYLNLLIFEMYYLIKKFKFNLDFNDRLLNLLLYIYCGVKPFLLCQCMYQNLLSFLVC